MKIQEQMQNILAKQINMEFFSSYLYLSMSSYFENQNLRGFAQWLRVQAKEEINHGMRLFNYILERGGSVELEAIDKPKTVWSSPLEAFEDAYNHECKVTQSIHDLLDQATTGNDKPTASMLQWFVDEQVEEEATTDEILQQLKMAKDSPSVLFAMDRGLGKRKDE